MQELKLKSDDVDKQQSNLDVIFNAIPEISRDSFKPLYDEVVHFLNMVREAVQDSPVPPKVK